MEPKKRILVVDDERRIRTLLSRHLLASGWQVSEAESCTEALTVFSSGEKIHTILCDVFLEDGRGWELLDSKEAQADKPRLIVMTGDPNIQHAVSALRRGACDFLLKPFSMSQLDEALVRSCSTKQSRALRPRRATPIDSWRVEHASTILGKHPRTLRMLEISRRVASTQTSVLITGESGTGKELVARTIHHASSRRLSPLITLNCAAIPENLIESELFGHVRGAFTGAISSRKGHFLAADKGTIFLDEIGELPLGMQSKLLRVLQEREVLQVGRQEPIPIDVRILAATNIDLERAVEDGRFREDLYYRLNVIQIEVPPLRERRSDIPELVAFFVDRHNRRMKREVTGVDPAVAEQLLQYDWPGNIRELENAVERMMVLSQDDTLDIENLPNRLRGPSRSHRPSDLDDISKEGFALNAAVSAFEERLIHQALEHTQGNKARAAKMLCVPRTTLLEKLRRLA